MGCIWEKRKRRKPSDSQRRPSDDFEKRVRGLSGYSSREGDGADGTGGRHQPSTYSLSSLLSESDKEKLVAFASEKPGRNGCLEEKAAATCASSKPSVVPSARRGGLDVPNHRKWTSSFVVSNNGVLTEYRGREKYVEIPEGIVEIGESAFEGNVALESLVIPGTVKVIGRWAFADCFNLRQLDLKEGILAIHRGAFSYCHSLHIARLPRSLFALSSGAFAGCANIEITTPTNYLQIRAEASRHEQLIF